MDFITDLPPSKRFDGEFTAVLVILDRFTKMALYVPMNSITSEAVADVFMERVVSRFGVPDGIVTDRGPQFTSLFWSELCVAMGIKHKLSTAFHPQTDGQTERQNQTLEAYLRIYANEHQNNWAKLLPLAEFAYNNSKHAITGQTPFFMTYGFHPEVHFVAGDSTARRKIQGLDERLKRLEELREALPERVRKASEAAATYYNARHEPKVFNQGDEVMLSTKDLKLKVHSKKLAPKFLGPLTVREPVGSHAYRLWLPTHMKIHDVINISRLEPYTRREDCEPPTIPVIIDDEEEWEVEEIVDKVKSGKQIWYGVKWKGYDDTYNSWQSEANLRNAGDVIANYEREHAKAPMARSQSRKKRRRGG
jgi:transposase InsO family protein